MDKASSVYPVLTDQTDFRLNRIYGIEDCFIAEIRKREAMSKRFNIFLSLFILSAFLLLQLLVLLLHL